MPLDPRDLTLVRDLILRRSGIVLDESKAYLIQARLTAVARKLGLASLDALMAKLRTPMPGDPLRPVDAAVEAMTTNETSFFRDGTPFDCVRDHVLPDLLARRATERRLNLWCAAASTGQEPYTLAMVLHEHFPQLASWTVTFLASDLSTDVLAKARAGRYSQTDINRGLPAALVAKYFRPVNTGPAAEYEVHADLRRMVDFRQVNLLDGWPVMPKLDLVFCRNVLIYFGQETKAKVLGRIRGAMRPDGYLFLGAAETTLGIDDAFERGPLERSGCYRLRRPATTTAPTKTVPAAATTTTTAGRVSPAGAAGRLPAKPKAA